MMTNEQREIAKKVLEWYHASDFVKDDRPGEWFKPGSLRTLNSDDLLRLYEYETRMYTIGEVWDSVVDSNFLIWSEWSLGTKEKITAFAERYHELKKEGRIKQ